ASVCVCCLCVRTCVSAGARECDDAGVSRDHLFACQAMDYWLLAGGVTDADERAADTSSSLSELNVFKVQEVSRTELRSVLAVRDHFRVMRGFATQVRAVSPVTATAW